MFFSENIKKEDGGIQIKSEFKSKHPPVSFPGDEDEIKPTTSLNKTLNNMKDSDFKRAYVANIQGNQVLVKFYSFMKPL